MITNACKRACVFHVNQNSRAWLRSIITLLFFFTVTNFYCQEKNGFLSPSDSLNKKRVTLVAASEVIGYSGTMLGLNELWYKQYPRSNFHFFNDNDQWLQIDKAGHATTAYYVGRLGNQVLSWSGVSQKKSLWFGGTLGLFFLTSVEVLDGFSSEWGFSWGDQIANTFGASLFISQEYLWQEQRLLIKFSSHPTEFAAIRPQVLGSSFSERLLKDYNGQTHWLSGNIRSFLPNKSSFPKWLNIAVGYSGTGMLFGNEEGFIKNCSGGDQKEACMMHNPQRQLYFSLDVDLTKIRTRSKLLKTFFYAFGFIKIPFPAIEYHVGKGISFRPLYF